MKHKNANVRVETVTRMAWELSATEPDSCLFYALAANKLITKDVSKANEAFNYHIIGSIYSNKADYENACRWLEKAYKIRRAENDQTELLTTINNLIYVWQGLGDVKMIHKYVLESEKICEERVDDHTNSFIVALNQLADIYNSLNRDQKAEETYLKAIEKAEINKSPRMLGMIYQNYSSYLIAHENYEKALKYTEKALSYLKTYETPEKLRTSKVNLAIVYAETGRKTEALAIFKDVYELELKGFDLYEKSSSANNLAFFYFMENKFNDALKLFMKSLQFAKDAKAFQLIMERYGMISETYEQLNDFKSSLKYSRLFQKLNDSLFNVETVKQLNDLTEKYGNEKKEKKILELKKNNAEIRLKEEETKRKSQRNNIIFGSLIVLVLMVAVFIYYSLVQKKKANSTLMLKNEQINLQHEMLEVKQKEILDSIHYARRIQQSLLPTEKYLRKKIDELRKK